MVLQKIVKTPESLFILMNEFEVDIFTSQSFQLITGEALGEWMSQLRSLITNDLIIVNIKNR